MYLKLLPQDHRMQAPFNQTTTRSLLRFLVSRKATQRLSSLICSSTLILSWIVLSSEQLLHLLLALRKILLKIVSNVRVGETQSEHRLYQFSLCKVERAPHPRSVGSRIGLQLDPGVDGMVGDDLHGLLLPHKQSEPLVLTMTKDFRLPNAALPPCFLARALVQERFAINEKLGSYIDHNFLKVHNTAARSGSQRENSTFRITV
mmetsp:Transcript_62844/g.185606  ORF Transcript_62844/g.185606 Transcript_62844/m.185606 type:complete len:204 (+) Transcript_62844:295-906(+)